jgi:prolyl-tRNA editing enzyme YbaK/EbsC (Cys-tRNA(Pro) deacylase)
MPELPQSAERVARAAKAINLPIKIQLMAQSTRTAQEAAKACGCLVDQIVKSLVFRLDPGDKPLLLLVSGANRVNEAKISQIVGGAIARPDADYVRETTGFAIGGIPPFGHAVPMLTLMDEQLLEYGVVWAAAGTPLAVFAADPKDLQRATGAQLISVG